jgi:hypothetical protein
MKTSISQALAQIPAAATPQYPAGAVHRFENFSNDFVTWVVFYGPQGGESP